MTMELVATVESINFKMLGKETKAFVNLRIINMDDQSAVPMEFEVDAVETANEAMERAQEMLKEFAAALVEAAKNPIYLGG
jgi:hypothetical protein